MSASFLIEAEREAGIETALEYVRSELALTTEQNPDVSVLSFQTLSVDDARAILTRASQTGLSGERVLAIACDRIFHEAQNALLKLFEEPPEGLTLFLITPVRGILLPTLVSRLTQLNRRDGIAVVHDIAEAFLVAGKEERQKIVEKLLTQLKHDSDEQKQSARTDALKLVEGVTISIHHVWEKDPREELKLLLEELTLFLPLLHARSAPYRQVFEHLLIVTPEIL